MTYEKSHKLARENDPANSYMEEICITYTDEIMQEDLRKVASLPKKKKRMLTREQQELMKENLKLVMKNNHK